MFLVMNDKGYGVIKHIQDALQGGRNYYADFQNPALEDVAKLAGMSYAKVGRAEELGDVVAKLVKTSGPCLVEVDMAAIGPLPYYFAEQVHLGHRPRPRQRRALIGWTRERKRACLGQSGS